MAREGLAAMPMPEQRLGRGEGVSSEDRESSRCKGLRQSCLECDGQMVGRDERDGEISDRIGVAGLDHTGSRDHPKVVLLL